MAELGKIAAGIRRDAETFENGPLKEIVIAYAERIAELDKRLEESESSPPVPMPLSTTTVDEIRRRFTYHAPFGTQPERYAGLRALANNLAFQIVALTPASREQSLALTKLEECLFFANAAIARREEDQGTP